MTDLALPRSKPLVGLLVVTAAVAGGAAILVHGSLALGLIGLLALLTLTARTPWLVPVYLMLVTVGQPVLMRLVHADSDLLVAVKHIDEFSLAILLPLALARHLHHRSWPLPRATTWTLVALTAVGIVATVAQGTPARIAGLDAFLLFKGFIYFVILSAYPIDVDGLRPIVRGAVILALIAAAFGLLELAFPTAVRSLLPLDRSGVRLGHVALISFFNHEGQSGWFFAFFASACYAFYWVYRRNAALALFALFSLCALLTLRRKAIGGLLVVLVLTMLLNPRTTNRLRTALIAAGAVLAVFVLYGDTVMALASDGYATYVAARDPSHVARNAMYLASFRIAMDYFPLGVGFGRFGGFAAQLYYSPVYFEYGIASTWGHGPRDPKFLLDAFWPHIIGQFGFIGVPLFLGALAAIWWPLLRIVRGGEVANIARRPMVQALALCAVLTFVEGLVESTAAPVFEATLSSYFVFGVPALTYAHLRRVRAGGSRLDAPPAPS